MTTTSITKANIKEYCSSIPQQLTYQEIEEGLHQKIVMKIPMEDFLRQKGHRVHFTTKVFWVQLASGISGVLKEVEPQSAIAEVAAYRASNFLGLSLVPPTVLRTEDRIIASLQYYVEPTFDLATESQYEEVLREAPPEDLANINIFYFVFGQWDPDKSNIIVVQEKQMLRLFLIDNAAMGSEQKVCYGEYPFIKLYSASVPKNEGPFPFDRARTVSTDPKTLAQELENILTGEEIACLCEQKWCEEIHFILWNGFFWRQFQFGNPSQTDLYPPHTMEALKKLDTSLLHQFFRNQSGFEYSDAFFNDILDRRDQIMQAYERSL